MCTSDYIPDRKEQGVFHGKVVVKIGTRSSSLCTIDQFGWRVVCVGTAGHRVGGVSQVTLVPCTPTLISEKTQLPTHMVIDGSVWGGT